MADHNKALATVYRDYWIHVQAAAHGAGELS